MAGSCGARVIALTKVGQQKKKNIFFIFFFLSVVSSDPHLSVAYSHRVNGQK